MGRLTSATGETDLLWQDGSVSLAFDPDDRSSGMAMFLNETPGFFRRMEEAALPGDDPAPDEVMPLFARVAAAPTDAERMLSALDADAEPTWRHIAASGISGLTAGAVIQTDKGECAIEDVQAGQRILTRDRGFQTVIWAGQRDLRTGDGVDEPDVGAVVIEAGALGPDMPTQRMVVSQHQCLLVEGPRTKLLFGEREVFVPASHLVGYPGITLATTVPAAFIYVMCEAHEVIWLDGVWTESFRAGQVDDESDDGRQTNDFASFSGSYTSQVDTVVTARRVLKRHEADILLA